MCCLVGWVLLRRNRIAALGNDTPLRVFDGGGQHGLRNRTIATLSDGERAALESAVAALRPGSADPDGSPAGE